MRHHEQQRLNLLSMLHSISASLGSDNPDERDLGSLEEISNPVSAYLKQPFQGRKLKPKLTIASVVPTVMRIYVITSIGKTNRCWTVGAQTNKSRADLKDCD